MSNILIRHSERSVFRKVTCDCKQPNDCDNELCSMHSAAYLIGKMPPNYPVPAIQYDVLYRPMGVAITRDYDGPFGDRFTFERTWFNPKLELN